MRRGQQSNLEWQMKFTWIVHFRWVVFLWQWQSIEWEIRKVVIVAIALYASQIVIGESMKPYLCGFDLWHACFRAPLRWMSLSWCARWTERLWLLVRFPRCIAIRPEQQNHCQVRTFTFFTDSHSDSQPLVTSNKVIGSAGENGVNNRPDVSIGHASACQAFFCAVKLVFSFCDQVWVIANRATK